MNMSLDFNHVLLDNITNNTLNFLNFLNKEDTIIWKNCENLNIIVNSKINKFIFENCKNIKVTLKNAIIGVELTKCSNIELKIKNKCYVELYKSNILINDINHEINNEKSKVKLL
jgi:hypothetical protein